MISIKISKTLKKELDKMKQDKSDTYDEIIKDLIEDRYTLNKETIKEIKQSQKQIKEGKIITFEELKRKYNL